MKGIVLAGGSGSRLYPIAMGISKQLLPVYDKPMIYYPLSVLMLAGIREIMVISTPQDLPRFQLLLGDGSRFGIKLSYLAQSEPNGVAEAFVLAESFIGDDCVSLVLGDNVFFGPGFTDKLKSAVAKPDGARIFGYHVNDPERFGVVEFDERGRVISIEEKPQHPRSRWAVTGLYIYDNDVVDFAKSLQPSGRGELEITDLNLLYMQRGDLHITLLGRGFTWVDAGTYESLLEASQYVHTIEKRQGYKIACLEEIGFNQNWLNEADLRAAAKLHCHSPYGEYLKDLLSRGY